MEDKLKKNDKMEDDLKHNFFFFLIGFDIIVNKPNGYKPTNKTDQFIPPER
jgi:hypothetical protein